MASTVTTTSTASTTSNSTSNYRHLSEDDDDQHGDTSWDAAQSRAQRRRAALAAIKRKQLQRSRSDTSLLSASTDDTPFLGAERGAHNYRTRVAMRALVYPAHRSDGASSGTATSAHHRRVRRLHVAASGGGFSSGTSSPISAQGSEHWPSPQRVLQASRDAIQQPQHQRRRSEQPGRRHHQQQQQQQQQHAVDSKPRAYSKSVTEARRKARRARKAQRLLLDSDAMFAHRSHRRRTGRSPTAADAHSFVSSSVPVSPTYHEHAHAHKGSLFTFAEEA